jgi:hypothetical protein
MKNPHAVALGKRRMEVMNAEGLKRHQRKAALAKWRKWRKLRGK